MIEVSRNLSMGQFVDNHSHLTRLDPRVKLLGAIVLITLVSIVNTFIAFLPCLLICLFLQWWSRLSPRYTLRGFQAVILFMAFVYVFQVLFYISPTQHNSLIWQWGLLSLSWEGLLRSLVTCIRVVFLYYLVTLLTMTTSTVDLTDGLESLFSPFQRIGLPIQEFVMVLLIAFKFVPIFLSEAERLIKAQTARGMRFDQGNVFQKATRYGSLLLPIFLSGFRRSETLATAMEARCYAGGHRGWRRSKRRKLAFQRTDLLALFCLLACVLLIVMVNLLARF